MLQYIIIRPGESRFHGLDKKIISEGMIAASIAGIICEHYHVLCHTEGYTWRYAAVYIECINFVSIRWVYLRGACKQSSSSTQSIALYGLLVFYGLMAEELKGKRPVAKFLAIKLIVMFTFYQTFMVSVPALPPVRCAERLH